MPRLESDRNKSAERAQSHQRLRVAELAQIHGIATPGAREWLRPLRGVNCRHHRISDTLASGHCRFRRKNGEWDYHFLAVNDDSWVRVKPRKKNRPPKN